MILRTIGLGLLVFLTSCCTLIQCDEGPNPNIVVEVSAQTPVVMTPAPSPNTVTIVVIEQAGGESEAFSLSRIDLLDSKTQALFGTYKILYYTHTPLDYYAIPNLHFKTSGCVVAVLRSEDQKTKITSKPWCFQVAEQPTLTYTLEDRGPKDWGLHLHNDLPARGIGAVEVTVNDNLLGFFMPGDIVLVLKSPEAQQVYIRLYDSEGKYLTQEISNLPGVK